MNLLLKITKHFTVKNIILGLIIILVGTLLKFIVIPKLLALFNVTLTEIIGYIVASFIALIIKLGIKDLVEELVDKLMPYLFMDTNSPHESGNESANEKPLDKGKGRVLSSSDSESEGESSKKRKLDKGKEKAIYLGLSSSLNEDKGSLIDRILDLKTSLEKVEEVEKRCIKDIEKSNDIDLITKLLEQKNEREKEIGELKIKISKLLEEGKENNTDFDAKVDSASYERYKAYRDLYGTPPSRDSSRPVSSSGHSSYAEFPPYNAKDYESESENKGESSSKK